MNSSAARTGRLVLQLVAEATQSHQLTAQSLGYDTRHVAHSNCLFFVFNENIFFFQSVSLSVSVSLCLCLSVRSADVPHVRDALVDTTLVLFEEIDVKGVDDHGFFNALHSLMTTTKRPIVMTCNGGRSCSKISLSSFCSISVPLFQIFFSSSFNMNAVLFARVDADDSRVAATHRR